MKVQELMTKDVAFCRPDDSLSAAAEAMWSRDCGCLPVCAGDGSRRIVGVITDRDICMHAYFAGRALDQLRVEGAMSREVCKCRGTDTLKTAERLMKEIQVRRLPVVGRDDTLMGMISLADLAEEAARKGEMGRPEITEAQVGDTLSVICVPRERAAA